MQNECGGGNAAEQQPSDVADADPACLPEPLDRVDPLDPADVAACLRGLARLADDPAIGDSLADVGRAVARAYKRVGKDRRQRAERQAARATRRADRTNAEATGRCRQEPRPAELLAAGIPLPPPSLPAEPGAPAEGLGAAGSGTE